MKIYTLVSKDLRVNCLRKKGNLLFKKQVMSNLVITASWLDSCTIVSEMHSTFLTNQIWEFVQEFLESHHLTIAFLCLNAQSSTKREFFRVIQSIYIYRIFRKIVTNMARKELQYLYQRDNKLSRFRFLDIFQNTFGSNL